MRKFLTVLIFVFGFCGPAVAGGHLENEKTPEKFLQYYFDAFNAQDAKKLDTVFATPFQRIRNGETVSYTSWREYINFEVVKKTGWKRQTRQPVEARHYFATGIYPRQRRGQLGAHLPCCSQAVAFCFGFRPHAVLASLLCAAASCVSTLWSRIEVTLSSSSRKTTGP